MEPVLWLYILKDIIPYDVPLGNDFSTKGGMTYRKKNHRLYLPGLAPWSRDRSKTLGKGLWLSGLEDSDLRV